MADQGLTSDRLDEDKNVALGLEEDDSDLDDTSISVGLNETGVAGGYHTLNDPNAPMQRQTVTERRGAIDIRCRSREVVHGFFDDDGDDFATLLVYDFHLDSTKRARRVASANVTFTFSSSVTGGPAPEIHAIAPLGRYSLMTTTQDESFTRGGELRTDAGQMGVSLGGSYMWEKTVSRTKSSDTRIFGATISNMFGKEVGANWVLHENGETKSGVPSFLRTAILLRRTDDEPFECAVTMDVKADWKTDLKRFFGSKDKDDAILFDPALPPTNKLRKSGYDTDNLGSIDVEEFFDTTFHTSFPDAIKGHVRADEKGVAEAHVQSVSETMAQDK
ncbi:MAG: hypothetical protein M1815_004014 [Lichina confinis]|nr:MAG: hypothetical protein M1815_004014 [Lichina confinis]